MVNTVSDIDKSYLSYCGQGFRDMTRIAASSPDIWTDISLLNRQNLIEMIALFRENLNRMEAHLRTADTGRAQAGVHQGKHCEGKHWTGLR